EQRTHNPLVLGSNPTGPTTPSSRAGPQWIIRPCEHSSSGAQLFQSGASDAAHRVSPYWAYHSFQSCWTSVDYPALRAQLFGRSTLPKRCFGCCAPSFTLLAPLPVELLIKVYNAFPTVSTKRPSQRSVPQKQSSLLRSVST